MAIFVYLSDNISAEVVPGYHLRTRPEWIFDLNSILISHETPLDQEQYIGHTIGSTDWFWNGFDELRFNLHNFLLDSVRFNGPEVTIDTDDWLNLWQAAPQIIGNLRLVTLQEFGLERFDVRWLHPKASLFAFLRNIALEETQDRFRLCIAQDVDLLFSGQRFCGCLLHYPVRYLTDAEGTQVADGEEDQELVAALHEYISLMVVEPTVDRMLEKDSGTLRAIQDLVNRLPEDRGSASGRKIVRKALEDVVDTFYS